MPESDDIALLKEYVHRNSESAFSTLVERHVNLIYSVALRSVGRSDAAEEITQAVFIIKGAESVQTRRVSRLALSKRPVDGG